MVLNINPEREALYDKPVPSLPLFPERFAPRDPLDYETFQPHEQLITIQSFPFTSQVNTLQCDQTLLSSMGINQDEVKQLFQHFESLIRDPFALLDHLKPIENALAIELKKRKIKFNTDNTPQFLIAGKGHYIPGYKPVKYQTKNKNRIIDYILLQKEQAMGMNKAGTPIFAGLIDDKIAEDFVSHGYIFKEDASIGKLLLHSKNAHRLIFQAFMESLKNTAFKNLTGKNLLKLLIQGKVDSTSLWDHLIDSYSDTIAAAYQSNKPQIQLGVQSLTLDNTHYTFSSQNPGVFNSLLLCFGEDFGLTQLQACLLDSHWKLADQMIQKNAPTEESHKIKTLHYIIVMEALTLNYLNSVGKLFTFTKDPSEASVNKKYCFYQWEGATSMGIKSKLARGETLSEAQRKKELFAQMKDMMHFQAVLIIPQNLQYVIDFLKEDNDPYQDALRAAAFICSSGALPIDYAHSLMKQLVMLERNIALVDSSRKRQLLEDIDKFNQKYGTKYSIGTPTKPAPHRRNSCCIAM